MAGGIEAVEGDDVANTNTSAVEIRFRYTRSSARLQSSSQASQAPLIPHQPPVLVPPAPLLGRVGAQRLQQRQGVSVDDTVTLAATAARLLVGCQCCWLMIGDFSSSCAPIELTADEEGIYFGDLGLQ